ncbi:hypothetical protein WMY93_014627 [Mugilogobius chulae]|uniref:Ig-like domain-containing protein n=1 Tax=Mugilogobius chulae TaxID=88201 RepID=A0AAW0P509_9GOBI
MTLLCVMVQAEDLKLIVYPKVTRFYLGERIHFDCAIDNSLLDWKITLKRNGSPAEWFTPWIVQFVPAESGDYQCEAQSRFTNVTKESNVISINVSAINPNVNLSADASVLAGRIVTLSCSVSPASSRWKYYWYKDTLDTPLRTTEEAELKISERGRYWCRGGRGSPVYLTHFSQPISIQTITPVSIGVVCVFVLLILLAFISLCWYKRTRERHQERNAESGLEDDAQNDTVDPHQQLYSSLLHGDENLYEALRSPDNNDNDAGETQDYNNVTDDTSS